MRYLALAVIMVLYSFTSHSQTYEVGAIIGGANFIGDVGSTTYISPDNLAVGGIAKWNRSKRHSFRGSLMYYNLEANDAESDDPSRNIRSYEFSNEVIEGSLGLEYTFWEYSLHTFRPQFTPYLYTGITGIATKHKRLNGNDELVSGPRNVTFAIPMIFGVKFTITPKVILGLEIGARYTFTDNIDGSTPEEFDGGEIFPSFGNQNTNDWYMFTGITLTYAFGRKPCYCNF